MRFITRDLTVYEQVQLEKIRAEYNQLRLSVIEMTEDEFNDFKREALLSMSESEIIDLTELHLYKGIHIKIVADDQLEEQIEGEATRVLRELRSRYSSK
jgi:hypothetical protein